MHGACGGLRLHETARRPPLPQRIARHTAQAKRRTRKVQSMPPPQTVRGHQPGECHQARSAASGKRAQIIAYTAARTGNARRGASNLRK